MSDIYATRLLARVYGELATAETPDVVSAVANARRMVQRELLASSDARDRRLALGEEWAAVSILAGTGIVELFDPAKREPVEPVRRVSLAIGGLTPRETGEFVGRRREQRRWPADLLGRERAGLVLYGIGGVGKTTLAMELIRRVSEREPDRVLVGLTGELSVERLLGGVVGAIRQRLLLAGNASEEVLGALGAAGRVDLPLADRLELLRTYVLNTVPTLVVLDNFEDNLLPGDGPREVRDGAVAELLAAWVGAPDRTRFLVTSRYPFRLPHGVETALSFRQLGPLSLAETLKLVWSLPALDRLDPGEVERVWRMVGGHPRALEYLDAVLEGGRTRFPDVARRLNEALRERLRVDDVEGWFAARGGLDSALASTLTLVADDVLLEELLGRIAEISGAERLLIGASVYREPVDLNALLYQVGEPDEGLGWAPDRRMLQERIQQVLDDAGLSIEALQSPEALPEPVAGALAVLLEEFRRPPVPPRRGPSNLMALVRACRHTTLLTVAHDGPVRVFVHRWTAAELARRWHEMRRDDEVTEAHRRAAQYWQWRVRVWPQGRDARIHDLLEARHHLLEAGAVDEAGAVTEGVASQLHLWGAWDQEIALIHDTLGRLPESSERRAAWIHQLGIVAQDRGDYQEAERQYRQSLTMDERLENQAGMASSYHQLGMLAQLRGDYEEAERQYRQSLKIKERLRDLAGMASSYNQLGVLAQLRGDYEEAEQQFRQSLEIKEGLEDASSLAGSYHNLGVLAQQRGDYEEAERQYRQSLEIRKRLRDQAGMASSYHQLGMLAQHRGDYEEAERQYRQSLEIKERLGDPAGMASSHHQLGVLAHHRGDDEEAERRYRQALEIEERLGNPVGVASCYHNLGVLAQRRGRYDEAERRYQQALEINERLGDPAGMASGYHQLGLLAQQRGDDEEAERRYRQALEIEERLRNPAGMALTLSQLGIMAAKHGQAKEAIEHHLAALRIRGRLQVPQVVIDLQGLRDLRQSMERGDFERTLGEFAETDEVAAVVSLLDEFEAASGDN